MNTTILLCPNCQSAVPKDRRFCIKCGHDLQSIFLNNGSKTEYLSSKTKTQSNQDFNRESYTSTDVSSDTSAGIGSLLADRYKVTKAIGGGGSGIIYLAQDIKRPGNPTCVVKCLKLTTFTYARRLFATEAEILEKLGRFDHTPTLLTHFEENQELYLVQEFIEGYSIRLEINRKKKLSENQVYIFLKDVLEIIFFIHSKCIIHRDIKPENIIRRKANNKLVLIDFGAAKQIQGKWGEHDDRIGSRGYAPPEQWDGRTRLNSDIYALGIVGIEALTGVPALQLNESCLLESKKWHHLAQVGQELAQILDKMVHSDYRKRYQLATAVLDDLRSLYK